MNLVLGSHEIYEQDNLKVTVYEDKHKPFSVGKRVYNGIGSLSDGLLVVHASELFPCFDESDRIYENRFYHWYLMSDTWAQARALRKQLRDRSIILPQLNLPAYKNSWRAYKSLPATVVYCEDDYEKLIVVENVT